MTNGPSSSDVAIVGMAVRLPGASSLDAFWRNLRDEVESITRFTDDELRAEGVPESDLRDGAFVKARGALADIDLFDAELFGFTPREAEITDPQQRLFLECVHEALEQAGCVPDQLGGPIGVFAGAANSAYLPLLLSNAQIVEAVGPIKLLHANDKDHLATRTAFRLNLRGPAVTVQTTCSTSLVAVHLACRSLLAGDCAAAIAGGVSISVPQRAGYRHEEGGILSPDGHCRAFDASARGTVDGSGVGVVLLRRLEDALAAGEPVRAVIKGSAVNNNGSATVGYTAPSVEGQAAVVASALAAARVDPETISYVEAHGTGTQLGDPAEIASLELAFAGRAKPGSCAIGSVKTNIGHVNTAAGVTGLIKTVLALEHATIPASLHFASPNPEIAFERSPFAVVTETRPWPRGPTPRRAGVSSFGIGGTNAHVVVEEAPSATARDGDGLSHVLTLSARTPTALSQVAERLRAHLDASPRLPLSDVAYTLNLGRIARPHRRSIVCRTHGEALAALAETGAPSPGGSPFETRSPPVVWMFPGQGTALIGLGRGLYEQEPSFRATLDACAEHLRPTLGVFLPELLYPPAEAAVEAAARLQRTDLAQPALFAVEYAVARLWRAWGVEPALVLGHSLGEWAAACVAGVFALEDALDLVAARGACMEALPPGGMLAVASDAAGIGRWLAPPLYLAAENGPRDTVVSGPAGAVDELARRLGDAGIAHKRLATHHAFHSAAAEPLAQRFAERVAKAPRAAAKLPLVSSVTGAFMTREQCVDPAYWGEQIVRPVRFADALATALRAPRPALLEIGPGATLAAVARRHAQRAPGDVVVSSLPAAGAAADARSTMVAAVARLWSAGVAVDWRGYHAGRDRRCVSLPTYPFERRRHWLKPAARASLATAAAPFATRSTPVVGAAAAGASLATAAAPHVPLATPAQPDAPVAPGSMTDHVLAVWKEALGLARIDVDENFFDLGGDSLLLLHVRASLARVTGRELSVTSLFEHSTVRQLAAYLSSGSPAGDSIGKAAERGARQRSALTGAIGPRRGHGPR